MMSVIAYEKKCIKYSVLDCYGDDDGREMGLVVCECTGIWFEQLLVD